MACRKIVFVIVEGPSDDLALGTLLERIYDRNTVHVQIEHGDITTRSGTNAGNVVNKVCDCVKGYARNLFKPKDFCRIIHITDTDGAFIPNDNVVEDKSAAKTLYSEISIRTKNKSGIEDRNAQKRENLNRLSSVREIWNIPYQIYYMSCNLDHALYGKLNSSDEEKEADATAFAVKYREDIPEFLKFITESDFSVMDDYPQSWQFIREGLHSLERHTNIGLCFAEAADEKENC